MKSQIKHITSFILLVAMIFSTIMTPVAYGFDFDNTQSAWAESEIKEALDLGLTYSGVMNNFKNYITREEFCTLAIKLYEKLSGKTASKGMDPFKDTDNEEILKAYELGIVKGTSADTFSPKSNITRQEICVMIFRTLSVSIANLNVDTSIDFPFKDAAKIASWATEAMKFAYKNEIMKGLSKDTIDPLSNTTREQGIALLLRTFKKYKNIEVNIIIPVEKKIMSLQKGPAPSIIQKNKFEFMVDTNNIFFPKFDKRIELFVSTKPGKPTTMPVFSSQGNQYILYASLGIKPIRPPKLPDIDINNNIIIIPKLPTVPDLNVNPLVVERPTGPVYTKSDFAAFVEKDGDKVRWFAFKLNNSTNATKVIYQVATSQFPGYKEGWNTQPTIVYSGEVATSAKEFSIDFSKVASQALIANPLSGRSIAPKQKTYYVRTVLVDSLGNPIGDPAKGIAVVYGETQIAEEGNTESTFEIWTPYSYQGDYSQEFKDEPKHPLNNEADYSPKQTQPRLFHFHGIDEKTKKIIIQVSNEKFENGKTSNIIYEKEYTLPVSTNNLPSNVVTYYLPSVLVSFSEFCKSASEMQENQYISYYVRGIALKESDQPGKLDSSYSDVIRIKYGFGPELKLQIPAPPVLKEKEKIKVGFPTVTIKEYKEVQWPDPDYMRHYYVADTPKPTEIQYGWKDTTTNETLVPYVTINQFSKLDPNFMATYQAAINRVLPVGVKVYFPEPTEKDEPWYKELGNGVINFFKDLVFYINKIYSVVKSTYSNLKNQLLTFVADLCPIGPLRGYFKTALEGLLNYGLMWVGIPPELPDFAALAKGNIDYFVDLALSEAGVPQNGITDIVRQEMEDQMIDQFDKAGKVKDENPIDAPFLKLDPDYMYRPAYVDIEVNNDTDYPSVAGTFDLSVEFKFKGTSIYSSQYSTGVSYLIADTHQIGGSQAGAAAAGLKYTNHFLHGLNGYTIDFLHSDEQAIYEVFKPMKKLVIPSIRKHEKQTIRVYLEPSYFSCSSRYPNADPSVYEDFYNMYFTHGNENYTYFNLKAYFPTAEEYLAQQAANNKMMYFPDLSKDYEYINGGEDYYYWDSSQWKYVIINSSCSGVSEELQKKVEYGWTN